MIKCKIFASDSIQKLEGQINQFLEEGFDTLEIIKILQSECEKSITITLFYRELLKTSHVI